MHSNEISSLKMCKLWMILAERFLSFLNYQKIEKFRKVAFIFSLILKFKSELNLL